MTTEQNNRVKTWVLAAAGLGVAGAAVLGAKAFFSTPAKIRPAAIGAIGSKVDEKSSLRDLGRAAARGDGVALAVLKNRLEAEKPKTPEAPRQPLTEEQATDWTFALKGVATGYPKFSDFGRATAAVVTSEVLHKFDAPKSPITWMETLHPASEVLALALNDASSDVRIAALGEMKGFWAWEPQSDIFARAQLQELADWKASLHPSVVNRLEDQEPKVRMNAVACLGNLRLDRGSEPVGLRVSDVDPGVRLQVLVSFADRPGVVSEEAILPLLHDPIPQIPPMAEKVLKIRGLTPEQIGLGKMVVHPRPDMRMSAIPFLKDRKDVDPTVWLIFLSRDDDEGVRLKAIDALAAQTSPEAKKRLAEMAEGDASKAVRQAAGKHVPEADITAALPPLPGAANTNVGLKFKAN